MAKLLSHRALDAAFAYVADRADRLVLCAGAPADYEAAARPPGEGGLRLGAIEMSRGLGQGDFSVADGSASGRKLIVARQEGVPIETDGCADHVALIDQPGRALLLVTALARPLDLEAGRVVSIDAFEDEIGDPV
ncbi:MAG: hypothetical protein AAFW46_11810 [Pseudomonadota bacterium]